MAVGRWPQFLAIWTSPLGCLSVLVTCQLIFPRANNPKESKEEATVSITI